MHIYVLCTYTYYTHKHVYLCEMCICHRTKEVGRKTLPVQKTANQHLVSECNMKALVCKKGQPKP